VGFIFEISHFFRFSGGYRTPVHESIRNIFLVFRSTPGDLSFGQILVFLAITILEIFAVKVGLRKFGRKMEPKKTETRMPPE